MSSAPPGQGGGGGAKRFIQSGVRLVRIRAAPINVCPCKLPLPDQGQRDNQGSLMVDTAKLNARHIADLLPIPQLLIMFIYR